MLVTGLSVNRFYYKFHMFMVIAFVVVNKGRKQDAVLNAKSSVYALYMEALLVIINMTTDYIAKKQQELVNML